MGWDLAAVLIILWGSFRGFSRGFLRPAAKISALIGAFFLAEPLRNAALPAVQPYFPAIQPATFAKMLWWASVLVAYASMAMIACAMIGGLQRRASAIPPKEGTEPGPGLDRYAGLVFGTLKGGLIVAILSALAVHHQGFVDKLPWSTEVFADSQSLALTRDFDPVGKLWESDPIVRLRAHVIEHGGFSLGKEEETPVEDEEEGVDAVPVEDPAKEAIREALDAAKAETKQEAKADD